MHQRALPVLDDDRVYGRPLTDQERATLHGMPGPVLARPGGDWPS